MRFINYEAWYNEEQIYNGTSKKEMINELHDFIEYRNEIDENDITENEINELNKEALSRVGIKIYIVTI